MIVKKRAYAKINWSLIVNEKLEDSYHSLDMLMQKISLCDYISFKESKSISCTSTGDFSVPSGEDNIAYKVAKLLYDFSSKNSGIEITIDKKIPSGTGLGGGSSDAACVLKTLNDLWNIKLSDDELSKIALKIGADVPYFLKRGLCHACNKGEILTPLNLKNTYYLVIIKHGEALSTKKIFESFGDLKQHKANQIFEVYRALNNNDVSAYSKNAINDLQPISEKFNPNISLALTSLTRQKAEHAMMSGSGSAVYGVFKDIKRAKACYETLKDTFDFVSLCKTIND